MGVLTSKTGVAESVADELKKGGIELIAKKRQEDSKTQASVFEMEE